MSPEDKEFADYYNTCIDEFRAGMMACQNTPRQRLASKCMQIALITYGPRIDNFAPDCTATASVLALIQEAYGSVHILSFYEAAGLCDNKYEIPRHIVLQFNTLYVLGIIESADPVTCLLKLNFSKFPKTAGLTKCLAPLHGIDFTEKVAKSNPKDIAAEIPGDKLAVYRTGLTNILNIIAKFEPEEEQSYVDRRR